MKILITVNHPAHVHLFRNSISSWIKQGDKVLVAARQRQLVLELLDLYSLDYVILSKERPGKWGKFVELFEHIFNLLLLGLRHRPNIYAGTSRFIGPTAKLMGGVSIVFNEDDVDLTTFTERIGYPLATHVVVPTCVRDKRTKQYIEYESYHELAYLHPNHFQPNPSVLNELGVSADEKFFILRLVALKAYHDGGHRGLSDKTKKRLIERLSQHGKVFITVEGELPEYMREYQFHIPPHRMHDALSYATLLVSDSQTMTAEAAVLGTPSLRCNTFVGRISYLEQLEDDYSLTFGFHPDHEEHMLNKLEELLTTSDLHAEWRKRQYRMLAEKVDFAEWITKFVTEYPDLVR